MNGQSDVVGNGVKLVGEAILPGASQMLDGRIGSGLLHTLASGVALAALGPIGGLISIAVRLNSFSSSVNKQNLWDLTSETISRRAGPPASAPTASASTKSS